jgi:hypothetical protein
MVWALATVDVTAKSSSSGAKIKSRPNVVVIADIPYPQGNSMIRVPRALGEGCLNDTMTPTGKAVDDPHWQVIGNQTVHAGSADNLKNH